MQSGVSKPRPCSMPCTARHIEVRESKPFFAGLKTPWEEFHRCQTQRLSRISAGTGVSPDQIADVLQEVWLAAAEHHEEFQGEDAEQRLSSWLVGVVRKKSIDTIRRLSRLRRLRIKSLDNLPAESVDKKAKEPAELMEAKERDETLATQLEELWSRNRLNYHFVCQHVLEDRSLPDLAAEIRLGVHAISCRISRTLKDLGARLQEG
jgi:RNA polymerase sigma factor (sigma-70 family)